jgi:hypothetical protein
LVAKNDKHFGEEIGDGLFVVKHKDTGGKSRPGRRRRRRLDGAGGFADRRGFGEGGDHGEFEMENAAPPSEEVSVVDPPVVVGHDAVGDGEAQTSAGARGLSS